MIKNYKKVNMNRKMDIYTEFKNNRKYHKKLVNFLRDNTTVETGGNKIFDGTFKHLLHIPEELADLIFFIKNHEIKKKIKIKRYLEIGFSHGFANTIFNKFFNFELIVAVDKFGAHINGTSLVPNLRFKNLILICNDSQSKFTIENLKKFEKFDLIFIDGDHDYKTVKNDFNNYKNLINKKNGLIVMHDIKLEKSGSKNSYVKRFFVQDFLLNMAWVFYSSNLKFKKQFC